MSDRFKAPRPSFKEPTNDLLHPKDQSHHSESPSLVARAQADGKDHIAKLIAQAQKDAKEQAFILEKAKKPRKSKGASSAEETTGETRPKTGPVVLSLEQAEIFIKITRSREIHDPEVKELFFQNNGQFFLDTGMTYGQAFEALRREARLVLNPIKTSGPIEAYHRTRPIPQGTRAFVSGIPNIGMKARAEEEANMRRKNAFHIGYVSPAKRSK